MNEEENQKQNQGGLGNTIKEVAKDAAKEKAKKLIMKLVAIIIPALPYIITFFVILGIALAAFKWQIDNDTSNKISEKVTNMLEEYCVVDEQGIHFNDVELEKQIDNELAEGGLDKEMLGLGVSDELASKFLYDFMTASLSSQLPYIKGSDKAAQGIIYLYRDLNEDKVIEESEQMKFVGPKKFQEIFNESSDGKKIESLQYFTIDELWNLCVFKLRKVLATEGNTYELIEVKIPYRTIVAQYGMPFEFLLDLQLLTLNPYYVHGVADLVNTQSKIDLTIFDDIEETTYKYKYTAKQHTRTKAEQNNVSSGWEVGAGIAVDQRYTLTTTDINEESTTVTEVPIVKANVTKAKTWILDQSTKYNYEEQVSSETTNITNPKPDNDPITEGTWVTDKQIEEYTKVVTKGWNKQETIGDIAPSKFLGLLQNSVGYYQKGADFVSTSENGKSVKYTPKGTILANYSLESIENNATDFPLGTILTSENWLYESLQSKAQTQSEAELMRYVIKLYRSKKPIAGYDGESFDASVYNPTEFVEGSYTGGFDVHDESLFITDREQLIKALKGYSVNYKLVRNVDALLDIQEKYKVNALFTASVAVIETTAGTKGNGVEPYNNWFNISGGKSSGKCRIVTSKDGTKRYWRTFSSEPEGIDAFGDLIANSSYYYTKGNYTVGTISTSFCPPTASQWAESVTAQIVRFYKEIGIDISDEVISDSGGVTSKDLKDLFPKGIPKTASEMQAYLVSIQIPVNNKNGKAVTQSITVHKKVADDVKQIFKEIQASGFKVYSVGGYAWRGAAASSSRSHHSYGVAIDINPNENYMIKNGSIISGSFWRPGSNEYSITPGGPVVKAFAKKGWTWGGNWSSSKDYMHFSLTGH